MSKLFVISACSGAGKTTLVTKIVEKWQRVISIKRVITYTTKKPREGEIDGRDYHFVSVAVFKQMIDKKFFIEWSTAYGNYYGSPKEVVEWVQAGTVCLIILDRVGAEQVAQLYKPAILIWINTPTFEDLVGRLKNRQTESDQEQQFRIAQAYDEIMKEKQNQLYQYHLINDQISHAVEQMDAIISKELKLNLKKN